MKIQLVSTSALAQQRGLDAKDLFQQFNTNGWIYKKDGQWHLTKEGQMVGGEVKYNPKYGEYIVWPYNIDVNKKISANETMSSTQIGEQFGISAQRVNSILSELGWIEKDTLGGWKITPQGKRNGGYQLESTQGNPYVVWEKTLQENKHFLNSVNIVTGKTYNEQKQNETDDFRKKYDANVRTQDGHYVRSRAEAMIDNYLYENRLVHAYERRLPIEEEVFSDFYILNGKVFIEYWGMEGNSDYDKRKKEKLEIYAQNQFNLIELTDKDIERLDDVLPPKLRKYGIKIE